MPTAAIITHDGFTDAEFLVAYHMLKAEGFDAKVYSLNGGPVTGVMGWLHKDSRAMHHLRSEKLCIEAGVVTVREFMPDILILIGGVKSIEKLRLHRGLIDEVRKQNDANGIIATICHGAQLCIEADIVRGRKVLGYNSIRKDLENAGAVWPEGQEVWVDRNIVSARHYDFAGIWMKEVLRVWRERDRQ